jgi:hypothetical protein
MFGPKNVDLQTYIFTEKVAICRIIKDFITTGKKIRKWYNNISRKVFTNLISIMMVFNAIFKHYFSYIVAVSLIRLRKPENPEYATYFGFHSFPVVD